MFNLGFSEILVLTIIALLFIGPKELPEMAKKLVRFLNELKREKEKFTLSLNEVEETIKPPKDSPLSKKEKKPSS